MRVHVGHTVGSPNRSRVQSGAIAGFVMIVWHTLPWQMVQQPKQSQPGVVAGRQLATHSALGVHESVGGTAGGQPAAEGSRMQQVGI